MVIYEEIGIIFVIFVHLCLNVVNAYVPQVGCEEKDTEVFW